jgi:ribosomal protein S18 acetylase RimI-like enzyme
VTLSFSIRPIEENQLAQVLDVYRQCEDFLALGPQPHASLDMILSDMRLSQEEGCTYCGIFNPQAEMMGIFDYNCSGFEGQASQAFISLLMIARPFRNQGLGDGVMRWFEIELDKHSSVRRILSGVQVNNPAAVRFWIRQGFRIASAAQLLQDGTTCYQLVKELSHGKSPAQPAES